MPLPTAPIRRLSIAFRASSSGEKIFYLKPAAAVVSARRAGTTAALDQLQKYFTISEMPVISSKYWNMVHGATPEDVHKDEEGLRTMRTLARNMAWFLKCKEAGAKAGVALPAPENPCVKLYSLTGYNSRSGGRNVTLKECVILRQAQDDFFAGHAERAEA